MTTPLTETNDNTGAALRIAVICHADDPINHELVRRWLASFADVVGVVLIDEHRTRWSKRLRAEYRRVGLLRLLDVFGFRIYYRLCRAAGDRAWVDAEIERRCALLPDPPARVMTTRNPNSAAVVGFLRNCAPQLVIARCKWLLSKEVFSVPPLGTFVLHPGICPQYRNAHGCFWAIANRDLANVGLTLLQVDDGIDTGPIYGYFRYPFDEHAESHIRIQHRVLLENFDAIRTRLLEIAARRAVPLEVVGKPSRNWGQPWLSAFLRARRAARGGVA
jgi:folate-dependent phosphoribosylglycinamide formyltransferase PurN